MSAPVRYLRGSVALLLGAVLSATPIVEAAAQTSTFTVDAQAGINYASNPFIIDDGTAGSFYADLSVQPAVTYQDERNVAAVIGRYRRSQYFTRYDGVDGYGVDLNAQRQLSSNFSVSTTTSFDSSVIGQGGFGLVGVVDPDAVPGLIVPDVALLGRRQRQTSLSTSLGAAWRMSARDSLNFGGQLTRSGYGNTPGLTSQVTKSGNIGYSRAISERVSVGLQGSASSTDFGRPGFSGSSYSPQATLDYRFSERFRLSAALGAVFISSTALGVTTKATGLSGSLSGCSTGDRSNFCISATSDAQATGLGDISRRLGAAFNYSYRLSEYDVVNASLDYSRVLRTSDVLPQIGNVGYGSVGGGYERQFSRRFSGGASANYRRVTGGGLGRPSDFNVRLYVRTRLGDIR